MNTASQESLAKAREIISKWDFSYVVERAVKAGMPAAISSFALDQLKAFLFECAARPDAYLAPQSIWCDDLWHEFIVTNTRDYCNFCDAVYGEYLHHDGVTFKGEKLEKAKANVIPSFDLANQFEVDHQSKHLASALTAGSFEYDGERRKVSCGISPSPTRGGETVQSQQTSSHVEYHLSARNQTMPPFNLLGTAVVA